MSLNVQYRGIEVPLAEQIELRAGPLLMIFEQSGLRRIKLCDREVLRHIYVAIRDRNWDTVPHVLSNEEVDARKDSFAMSYDAENWKRDLHFRWHADISGAPEGRTEFKMSGCACTTFLRNRIGLVVLHPTLECAGQLCEIEHTNGSVERSWFPRYIAPHQPFLRVRALRRPVYPDVWAEVLFAGDIFETEDQRNWTDDSYKTYSTPLERPFPVEVQTGTRIEQSVNLTFKGNHRFAVISPTAKPIVFSTAEDANPRPLPQIGVSLNSDEKSLGKREIERLRAANISHLRVDLKLWETDYEEALVRATSVSTRTSLPLEVVLMVSGAAGEELQRLLAVLHRVNPNVLRWLIFNKTDTVTRDTWVALARKQLGEFTKRAQVAAGTNAYFAELNRDRLPGGIVDAVCYSISPQVHASDNLTLIENLPAQASTVRSGREFLGDIPIVVSPVTLKPCFNPNVTGPEAQPASGDLPRQVDDRQPSLFAAVRTLGSIKYLAEEGAHSITYYETMGWKEIMEGQEGSPLPTRFQSIPGAVFPMYHVFADIGEFAGGSVIPSASSNSLAVNGLLLRKADRQRILLANFTPIFQKVRCKDLSQGKPARIRALDLSSVMEAMLRPEKFRAEGGQPVTSTKGGLKLNLQPYAVVRVDSHDTH